MKKLGSHVPYPCWVVYDPNSGVLYASLCGRLDKSRAKRIATSIATGARKPLGLVRENHGKKNPTLVHHGIAQRAAYHLWTESPRGAAMPVADLYFGTQSLARSVASYLADHFRTPVKLAVNLKEPHTFATHQQSAATFYRPNPKRKGRKGVAARWAASEKQKAAAARASRLTVHADYWIEKSTAAELAESPEWPYRMVTTGGQRFGLSTNGAIRAQKEGLEFRVTRNPSRSKSARARRRGGLKSRTSSKVYKAAVRAVRRAPFPGNAAQTGYYLERHRFRKSISGRGPARGLEQYYRKGNPGWFSFGRKKPKKMTAAQRWRKIAPILNRAHKLYDSGLKSKGQALYEQAWELSRENPRSHLKVGQRVRYSAHKIEQFLRSHSGFNYLKSDPKRRHADELMQELLDQRGVIVTSSPNKSGFGYGYKIKWEPSRQYPNGITSDTIDYMVTSENDPLLRGTGSRSPNRRRRNPIPKGIDKRSVRSVGRGRKRILVGCPAGKYSPRKRRCKVGMRKVNPRTPLERAKQAAEMWHDDPGFEPRTKRVAKPDPLGSSATELGELVSVAYKSNKYTGRATVYEHDFKRPRPLLVSDPDAKQLHIVGGRVKITRDGLVN